MKHQPRVLAVWRVTLVGPLVFIFLLIVLNMAYGVDFVDGRIESGIFYLGEGERWVAVPHWIYSYFVLDKTLFLPALLTAGWAGFILKRHGDLRFLRTTGSAVASLLVTLLLCIVVMPEGGWVRFVAVCTLSAIAIPTGMVINRLVDRQ